MQKLDAVLLRQHEEYTAKLSDSGLAAAQSAPVRVVMRFTSDLPRIIAQGFKVFSEYGPVVAGAVALANLEKIATMSNVVHIEAEKLHSLLTHVRSNRSAIIDYGVRYKSGRRIASSLSESAVNSLVTRRMVKKQQMQRSSLGARRMLQVRAAVLNGELNERLAFGSTRQSRRSPPGLLGCSSRHPPWRKPRDTQLILSRPSCDCLKSGNEFSSEGLWLRVPAAHLRP